jgi:hypothetical protein
VFQHVALTYDQASGVATIYCNGQIVSQQTIGSVIPQTTYNLYLGKRPMTVGEDESFDGKIDEAAIFNRALSSNEIAAIYNAGSAGMSANPAPPVIVTQPTSQIALVGSTATFSVSASGTGPLKYQWALAGKKIAGATNATLTLTNLRATQGGYYEVTVTSPYGATSSVKAMLTLSTLDMLVYKYAGTATLVASNKNLSFAYSGYMYFEPDTTNFTYIGWAFISGKKLYWVNTNTPSFFLTIPGNPSYTVFGDAGASYDDLGQAHINSDMIKGTDTTLKIDTTRTFEFPATFTCENNHVYPDPNTGEMDLNLATSTFTYVPLVTQAANNTGQTLQQLINAQVQQLTATGYRPAPLPQ